jgi:hypothetical protein
MTKNYFFIPAVAVLLICGDLIHAGAQPAGKLVKKGNQAFASQQYEEAYDAYEEAAVAEPESPRIYFNKGAVRYMQGDYLQAVDLFAQAAQKSKDLRFEARSLYNTGNSYFRESERQRDSDLQKSLEDLEKSIDYYQQAVQLDDSLDDAAHNIEVVRLTMKQVLDELKNQQERDWQQQEKRHQQTENLQDLIKRQDGLSGKTKELQDRAQGQKAEQTADRARELAEEQRQIRKETEQLGGQLSSDSEKNETAAAKAKEHLDQAVAEQETAADELQQNRPPAAQQAEKKAAEALRQAQETLQGKSKQDARQDQAGQEQEQQAPAGRQSQGRKAEGKQQEAAGKVDNAGEQGKQQTAGHAVVKARDIINEEKANREQRQSTMGGGFRPVDKDW